MEQFYGRQQQKNCPKGVKLKYPQTSLMRLRTALVLLERIPFLREGRGGSSRRRTTWPLFMPTAMPNASLANLQSGKDFFEINHVKFSSMHPSCPKMQINGKAFQKMQRVMIDYFLGL